MPQHLVQSRLEVEQLGGPVKAGHHRLERVLLIEEAIFVRADYSIGGKSKVGCHEWMDSGETKRMWRRRGLSLATAARSGELIKDVFDTADSALDANALRNIP